METLHVLVIGEAGTPWMERMTSILTDAGLSFAAEADPTALPDNTIADVAVVHASDGDPLVLAAQLWGLSPALPIVFSGDALSQDTRSAAFEAGVAFVTTAQPTPEELVAALRMACEQNRAGSPELVRAMCRTMCNLSSLVASATDASFLAAATHEISALFQAPVVSVMLVDPSSSDSALRVVAEKGLGARGQLPRKGGIAERVFRSRRAQIILRSAKVGEQSTWTPRNEISASMCVPIPAGHGVRGVVNIARTKRCSIFTPRDLEIATSIAGLVGEALMVFEARELSATLQHRMAAVERLSTVGEIAGGIAHEVANPIACVRSNVDTIIEYLTELAPDLNDLEAKAPHLKEILDDLPSLLCETWEGLSRADDVIRQMKGLVRLNGAAGPSRTEQVPLKGAVSDTLRLLRPRLKIEVAADLQDNLRVLGSNVELCQVMVNLLVNAGDACEERRVRARENGEEYRPLVQIKTRRDGRDAILTIEDNGCGISKEQLGRIFLPLFTTKTPERGTGLGLSIVRRVIEDHGGTVRVSSAPGQGTCFTIALPLLDAEPLVDEARSAFTL